MNSGEDGPPRCQRCKAYVNPFTLFTDNGDKFRCNFCSHSNMTPPSYVCALNHDGTRLDKYERPELCCGSVEFVATKEYMVCFLIYSIAQPAVHSCLGDICVNGFIYALVQHQYKVLHTNSTSQHHIAIPCPRQNGPERWYLTIAALNTKNVYKSNIRKYCFCICGIWLQVRPPMTPTHFFLIDVSFIAVTSGATAAACASVARVLDELPGMLPTAAHSNHSTMECNLLISFP